jgi:hypothetical protein
MITGAPYEEEASPQDTVTIECMPLCLREGQRRWEDEEDGIDTV